MKKILAVMLIIMSVCATGFARHKGVDPGRWVKLYETEDYVYYIDSTSVKFTKEAYGTAADVWIMAENEKEKTRDRANVEINLDRHEMRTLGTYAYNKRDKLISASREPEEFRPIHENSYEEALFAFMEDYHGMLKKANYQIPERQAG